MRYTNRRNFTLRPGNRTSNDDDVVQTAGDSRQTGDVSNRCAAFRHALWRFELQTPIDCCVEFCTALAEKHPANAACHAEDATARHS